MTISINTKNNEKEQILNIFNSNSYSDSKSDKYEPVNDGIKEDNDMHEFFKKDQDGQVINLTCTS